jgi:putative membrane protein
MVMSLSDRDRVRISDAIRATEARTSGEIVCVLARNSSDATALPVFIAAVLSLALPWGLVAFTALAVREILLLQATAFLALAILLCLPPVRVALMPRAARRAAAWRAATDQFAARGIARKKDRAGILIFVSLAERYARIIADDGIAARVAQTEWQGAVDALVAHMREGRISDGFIAAIDRCGQVLATHFPSAEANRAELPDRIYLI